MVNYTSKLGDNASFAYNSEMNFKQSLKIINEGFKDKLKAAALATAIGTSSAAGAIAAAPMEPEVQHTQQYQAATEPQQTTNDNGEVAPHTDSIEDHIEKVMDFIETNEGRTNKVYKDTKGHPTIGVGFNLDRGDAKHICHQLGVNYKNLKSGRAKLTDEQIDQILEYDTKRAITTARKLVSNFNEQPLAIQIVTTDLAFNMGESTLSDFDGFLNAIENGHYEKAIKHLRHSVWYTQTGNRSKKDINLVASVLNKHLNEDEINSIPKE